jgi:diacylglycerol kinase (ATP)
VSHPTPSGPVFVIFNPAAGRGRGAGRASRFLELLREELPSFEHASTTRAGEERSIAAHALDQGFRTIVACGGDGTWSSVADVVLLAERPGVRLALLPGGTGNDFGKSFGITFARARDVVRGIARGTTRRIDVGRVGGRHFLNVVGLGFDIAVIRDAEKLPLLQGDALYKFCALRQLFRFPGIRLSIAGDFGPPIAGDFLMVTVSNAKYFGGSFLIAPRADVADGKLDVVAIGNAGALRRAKLFGLVAKGRHVSEPEVRIAEGRSLRIESAGAISYEVDGEVLAADGALDIAAVPGALELVVPAGDARGAA